MNSNKIRNFIATSVRLKSIWIIVCATLISAFFVYSLSIFRTADEIPEIQLIDMAMRKKISNFASVVRTGMHIKNFELFDIRNDRFIIGAVVWFEFNADEAMLETIGNFSFINGKILKKYPGDVRINGKKMFVKYDVRIEVKSRLHYNYFPFDDHRITLAITNNYVTPNELYFTVDTASFQLSDAVFTASWQLKDVASAWGYADMVLDTNEHDKNVRRPVVTYSMNFVKSGIRQIIIIFIPLLAAIFLALASFLLGISNVTTRFRLSMSAFTAVLSYRFVIERMMPSVGYFTTTDAIYTLTLLWTLLIFIYQVGIGRWVSNFGESPPKKVLYTAEVINSWLFYVTTFIGAITFGIFMIR